MTPIRAPRVAGVAGGVGTTVIATLIGADDAGVLAPGECVDVVVCRSVAHQLATATSVAATMSPPPVVVIVADCADKPPRPVTDRARMLAPNVTAVVWCPWLPSLRAVAEPAITARDGALADPTPSWARRIRECREAIIAAVIPLLEEPLEEVGHTPTVDAAPGYTTDPPVTDPAGAPPNTDGSTTEPPTAPTQFAEPEFVEPDLDSATRDSSGPGTERAVSTVRALRPTPPAPTNPPRPVSRPAPVEPDWSTVTPDAPPPQAPRGPQSGDADRLRRTS